MDIVALFILAALIRLIILPFTLKIDKRNYVIGFLYRILDARIRRIATRYAEDPSRTFLEEVSEINAALNRIPKYTNPLFYVIPVLLQALACLSQYSTKYSSSGWPVEFLWLKDLSIKDPYYVLSPILVVLLIVRFRNLVPYKIKYPLIIPILLLFSISLNFPAAVNIFVIFLLLLSTTQSAIVNHKYKSASVSDLISKLQPQKQHDQVTKLSAEIHDANNAVLELREWINSFKQKITILAFDDVLLSLLFGAMLNIGALIIFLMYFGYFRWREKRQWLNFLTTSPSVIMAVKQR